MCTTEHPSIARVRRELERCGSTGEIRVFSYPVRTAAAAAAALGCQVGAIVNSLIFEADGIPVLILTSAYIDPWLRQHETIWAAAGHPDAVFSTTYDELAKISAARPLEVD